MCFSLRQHERGMTIAEMWLAIAVASVVISALLAFSLYAGKSFAAITNYVDLEQKSQIALDTLTREIRQTVGVKSYSTMSLHGQLITNSLTFMLDTNNNNVTYAFTNGALMRMQNGVQRMLLTNCDYLSFVMLQRNSATNNTFDQFPAGLPATCKEVTVTWVCSRSILGSKINTESVQTAKIVIRKS